ncbi:MAG: response regulator [Lachnospiraceae bacterium]|nr:response regulator [Lachnospiraceae bacterium]
MDRKDINVLAIDDDLETLETIKLYLSDTFNVTVAANGRQALIYARQQKFDVILLDIEMPVMNGFQTLEQLRNLKECINISVIIVTGKSDKYSVMDSVAMGIDGYLIKPVNRDELIHKILEVCENKRRQQHVKTVLAIDDDMSYLKQLNSILKDYYNVIMINSTKLALDYLTTHTPDVILLDYQMPLYNGVALLSIIRQNGNNQNIPIIILSGTMDQKVLLDFYPYSPAAFLAKPVSKNTLLEKLQEVLM